MNGNKRPRRKAASDLQDSQSSSAAKLGPDIKAKIGQQLRVMYGEVVSQGVPDRFVDILRGLDDGKPNASESKSDQEGSNHEPT